MSDEEAIDYEVAGALARLRGAVRYLVGSDADRVTGKLHDCISELERAAGKDPHCGEGHAALTRGIDQIDSRGSEEWSPMPPNGR